MRKLGSLIVFAVVLSFGSATDAFDPNASTSPSPGPSFSNPMPASPVADSPALAVLPRPQTIEGEVLRFEGNSYIIKDISGKEVRLQVDRTTNMDSNLTAGDKIVARTSGAPTEAPAYVRSIYVLGSPQIMEGELVRVDGNTYLLRDPTGRELPLYVDVATVREGVIRPGDRIVVLTSRLPVAHAESIIKK
jgi:uncharacterized protein YdeI (BOF family)